MSIDTEDHRAADRSQNIAPGGPMDLSHGKDYADSYTNALPFPHIVIDNLFDEDILSHIADEVGMSVADREKDFYGSFNKRRISDVRKMAPTTRQFIEDLNSAPFIEWLESVTGISGLIPDPYLEGGGVHQIGTGGFLKVHTDFNWHRKLNLHRRINVLVYLNRSWNDDWNGQLELWEPNMAARSQSISPIFNRMVIFSTNDESYHGHPDPLKCPENILRGSIAMYYYSAQRPANEIKFAASEMTNYQPRPDEKFSGKEHALHQAQIGSPTLRKILSLFRKDK